MIKVKFISSLFLILACFSLYSQDLFTESKVISKEIKCDEGDKFSIKGERTFLQLNSWNEDFIKAEISVIAKHNNQAQAQADLEKIIVKLSKSGDKIQYSNALRISSPSEKPKSNLKIFVELTVPSFLKIDINNVFGKLEFSGEFKFLKSKSEFSPILISDVIAELEVESDYGDIEVNGISGITSIDSKNSDISIIQINSELDLDINYGQLEIVYGQRPLDQNIEAKYSPVELYFPAQFDSNVDIECKRCKIITEIGQLQNEERTESKHSGIITKNTTNKSSLISVKSEIEDVQLLIQPSLTNQY